MEIIGFIIFLAISHFGLMLIFKLTTYHKFFWWCLPLLVAYSAAVAWVLFILEMHTFFLWQVVLASAWLIKIGATQRKSMDVLLAMGGDDPDAVRFLAESGTKTLMYYVLSSIIYVLVFSITYIWLYNI